LKEAACVCGRCGATGIELIPSVENQSMAISLPELNSQHDNFNPNGVCKNYPLPSLVGKSFDLLFIVGKWRHVPAK
jgi:hypothetical protein